MQILSQEVPELPAGSWEGRREARRVSPALPVSSSAAEPAVEKYPGGAGAGAERLKRKEKGAKTPC